MKTISIQHGPQNVSAVIQGCMRMPDLTKEEAGRVIRTACDCGSIKDSCRHRVDSETSGKDAGNYRNDESGSYQGCVWSSKGNSFPS